MKKLTSKILFIVPLFIFMTSFAFASALFLNISTGFSINLVNAQEGKSITFTSPAGGESYVDGDIVNITWDSTGIDTFVLSFRDAGCTSCQNNIDLSVDASTGSYSWNITEDIFFHDGGSKNLELKARYSKSGEIPVEDISGVFTYTEEATPPPPPPTDPDKITVIYPNGNEIFEPGKTYTVRWLQNFDANVTIALKRTSSELDRIIFNENLPISLSSENSYTFTLKNVATATNNTGVTEANTYKLEISAHNGSVYINDSSDAPFTIKKPSTNLPPTNQPASGKVTPLRAEVKELQSNSVRLEGKVTVDYTPTYTYFTISEKVGDVGNQFRNIITTPKKLATPNGVRTHSELVTNLKPNTLYSYSFNVETPNWLLYCQFCKSKQFTTPEDSSTEPITPPTQTTPIPAPPSIQTPSVTVLSPNGGEVWKVGEKYTIKWNTGDFPSTAKISIGLRDNRYNQNLGSGESSVINNISNTGNYKFTVPESMGSLSGGKLGGEKVYTLVVYAENNGSRSNDISNAPFSIIKNKTTQTTKSYKPNNSPAPTTQIPTKEPWLETKPKPKYKVVQPSTSRTFINIVSPNGGEKLSVGKTHTIKWESSGKAEAVDIYLVSKTESPVLIVKDFKNIGEYDWVIPDSLKLGSYKINIKARYGSADFDTSDGSFYLIKSQTNNAPNVLKKVSEDGLEEKQKARIKAYSERIAKRLYAATERVEKLTERVISRIEKFEERGIDASAARAHIEESKAKTDKSRVAIEAAKTAMVAVLESDDPQSAFEEVRAMVKSVVGDVKSAHSAVVDAVGLLKTLIVEKN